MHLFQALVILFAAISISGIAAFVSITGMMSVFPSEPLIVAIIMASLEFGKVTAVEWLHSNWRNQLVTWFHKFYMIVAVVALMLVTAIGIYGFFSKGYLDQGQPSAINKVQLANLESEVTSRETQITLINERVSSLDSVLLRAVEGKSDMSATRANAISRQQKSERDALSKERAQIVSEIASLRKEMIPLTQSTLEVEAKLGPVKYLADLLGMKDHSSAIQLVIVVLMLAFDPFAICLVISASISFKTWLSLKNKVEQPTVTVNTVKVELEPEAPGERDEVNPVITKPVPLVKKKKPRKKKDTGILSVDDVAAMYLAPSELDKVISHKK